MDYIGPYGPRSKWLGTLSGSGPQTLLLGLVEPRGAWGAAAGWECKYAGEIWVLLRSVALRIQLWYQKLSVEEKTNSSVI